MQIVERGGASYRRHPVIPRRVAVMQGPSGEPGVLLARLELIARDAMASPMAEVKMPDSSIVTLPYRALDADATDALAPARGILTAAAWCGGTILAALAAIHLAGGVP
jgi:hypothetical protein